MSGKAGSISWDIVCSRKKFGGLGVRNLENWNLAALGKHVWAVACKHQNLWVKWVYTVYIKGNSWWDYKPGCTSSSYWRKLCGVKERIKSVFDPALWRQGGKYSIKMVYQAVQQVEGQNYGWDALIWERMDVPKHCFVGWMAMHDRLKTMERLCKIGLTGSELCPICAADAETRDHLFFACKYSTDCISCIMKWIRCSRKPMTVRAAARTHRKLSGFGKRVFAVSIVVVIYHLWRVRNDVVWNRKLWCIDHVS